LDLSGLVCPNALFINRQVGARNHIPYQRRSFSMYAYVCFDVEDLVHPDSDDIARDIADMLADDGVVASMYVVGEKARLWEQRGRTDVIAAVGQHDVALHTDHHSVHPTVSEYLADKGWADGVAEAVRQEEPGVRDLARLFGAYPSSWGTGGSGWGPQIPAATRLLGVPSNVYSHAFSGRTGACWFAGQLCYSDWVGFPGGEDAYADDTAFEVALPAFLQRFEDARDHGASCLGLFAAHPTRLRYTVFWDALNFARGQNTAPGDYHFAPRRTDEAYATSLRNLRRAILAVGDLPGIELISNRALNNRFALKVGPIAWADGHRLAQETVDSDTIRADNPFASPAQALDVLARAVLRLAAGGTIPTHVLLRTVLGPVDPPPALDRTVEVDAEAGLSLCRDLLQHIAETGHLPSSLVADSTPVGPGPLLRAISAAYLRLDRGQPLGRVTFQPGAEEPTLATSMAEDVYQRIPHWVPHSDDLRLDQLALHARLQSWSLKPAVLT
jgi:hypothetical protein